MNIFEVKTRLPNSSLFNQPSRRSPQMSLRQPRSSSLSSSRNDFIIGSVRTNIPVRHIDIENSKPTSFSYFSQRSTPSSPSPSLRIPNDNTGKYIARIVSNTTGRPTLVSSSASYFQPMDSNEEIPNVTTILPVIYKKDINLPIIRNTSSRLRNNFNSADSGVGSASSILKQNIIPSHQFTKIYSNGSTVAREQSPYRLSNKQYSIIKGIKDRNENDVKKPFIIGKLYINEPNKTENTRSGSLVNVNRDISTSNLNRISSNTSLNSQSNTPTKSILVSRKKFANPPTMHAPSPTLPKKTVTFAN